MPKTRPRYPAAFRQQTIELVQAGKTPAELSCEFGCSAQTILNWVRQSALRPCPEAAWPYQAISRGQSSPAFAPARRRCPAFSRRLACALRQRRTRYPHTETQTPPGVSVPSRAPSLSAPSAPTSPHCANRSATSCMPSLSPFKVKHQILCHPGKLNGDVHNVIVCYHKF